MTRGFTDTLLTLYLLMDDVTQEVFDTFDTLHDKITLC